VKWLRRNIKKVCDKITASAGPQSNFNLKNCAKKGIPSVITEDVTQAINHDVQHSRKSDSAPPTIKIRLKLFVEKRTS